MNEYIEYNKNTKLYKCKKCNKDFKDLSNLKRHLERKKSCILKTEYKCKKCLKVFNNLYNYKLHINRKTNCLDDINAPYKTQEKVINNEDLEIKIKQLEEEINKKELQIQKFYEDNKKNNKFINDWIENLMCDYTDIVVLKREPKILSLITYLKDFLLKKDNLDMYKIKAIIHYIFNKIKIENLEQIISNIIDLDYTKKEIIFDIIKEYIISLENSNNETIYGKLRINYISTLKQRFKL